MKSIFNLAIILCFTHISCQNSCKSQFDRKEELFKYFLDNHAIDLTNQERSFVVIISGHCGSCTRETIEFMKKIGDDETFGSYKKYVLVPDANSSIIPELQQKLGSNFNILEEEDIKLLRYGLLYSKNLFIELNRNRIRHWGWLYMEEIYTIKDFYSVGL